MLANIHLYVLTFGKIVSHSSFYKTLFYKNVEAEIDPDFKNMLRTYASRD